MRFHHMQIAIPAGNEALCRTFYSDLLGFVEIPKPDALAARGGVWFQVGDHELHLGVEDDFKPAKKAHPAFLLNDLKPLSQKLEIAHYVIQWDDNLLDYHRFFTHDPVGNRIEFLQNK